MDSFFHYLLENYGVSVKELSKTDFGNYVVDEDIIMIDLDEMARQLSVINPIFQMEFASADALLIIKNNDFSYLNSKTLTSMMKATD